MDGCYQKHLNARLVDKNVICMSSALNMTKLSQPSVVIVIPAYNAGSFLKEAIESSLRQSYTECRLIVINDCSTDGTKQILGEYVIDSRVTIVENLENKGKSESLNEVLPTIEEKYVALMDADDVMYPHRIEKQVSYMEKNPNIGASSGFMEYISSDGRVIGNASLDLLTDEDAKRYEKNKEPFAIFCPCAILRTAVFREENLLFRKQFWPADDIDMWNRVYETKWRVIAQPEILMQYRIHGSSAVTSNYFRTRQQFEYVRECMRARRRGDEELTHEEFLEMMAARPWWVRGNHWRKICAKGMYRSGGFDVAEGNYFGAAYKLAVAAMLQPIYVSHRLYQQVGQR